MKIADTTLHLEANSSRLQQHAVYESLRASRTGGMPSAAEPSAAPLVQISDGGRQAQMDEARVIEESRDAVDKDPMLSLIRAMVEMLTGREVKVFDPASLDRPGNPPSAPAPAVTPPPAAPGAGTPSADRGEVAFAAQRHESYLEIEQSSFQASGTVRTADGKEIDFTLTLEMHRRYARESTESVSIGAQRQTKDPLVLNFNGTATELTSQRFHFDLNADGRSEEINFAAAASGFLVFDRNGDNQVNDGRELFGALSGDGFAELASLDSDGNGWIDEGDAAYERLRVWTKSSSGTDQLTRLSQAGIGALSVAALATPFSLTTDDNRLLGQIRSTGVYLDENGSVGTMQQVDLTI
ncbi:MAG: VCBS repeat-containing protein [Candidatus Accumulibacter sp.]|nr:VCBS repeat-containing protein [Accumulibacter sp.]